MVFIRNIDKGRQAKGYLKMKELVMMALKSVTHLVNCAVYYPIVSSGRVLVKDLPNALAKRVCSARGSSCLEQ
ncbi:hypothetical protein RRG08_012346 [Elysia crispata]|uniref:Uncharacterized protein n=1 Tax=Elysia crispata TaxID=231223 RepID=A0AAE1AC87_9GAST|nr:hypothetical protein RRG08_012346 [Elysia crispata]